MFVGVAGLSEGCLDFGEDRGIVDGGRGDIHVAVGDFLHGAAKNLARASLGETLNNDGSFERGNWSDVVADHLHDFCGNSFRIPGYTALEDQKAEGNLAFQLVVDSEDGAFGDVGVRGKNFLDASRREAMAGDIDNVVGAGHYEDIAVVVHVPCVSRFVIARKVGEIGIEKALVVVPESGERAGRERKLDNESADFAALEFMIHGIDDVHVHSGDGFRR